MGWRDITNATNERTMIATVMPRAGVNHKAPLIFSEMNTDRMACLLANFSSLVLDFVARQKIGRDVANLFLPKTVCDPSSHCVHKVRPCVC